MTNRFTFLFYFLLLASFSFAQDTIVVQAWNFDSTTRDTVITFPDIDHNEYEQILMLYRMRCKDGLVSTGSDRNRGCGEWDYSCNTSIIDSSIVDSLRSEHPNYIVTGFDGNIFEYTTQEVYDYYQYELTNSSITNSNNVSSYLTAADTEQYDHLFGSGNISKSYYLIKAEDISANITDEIRAISINVAGDMSDASFMRIRMGMTASDEFNHTLFEDLPILETYFYDNASLVSGGNILPLSDAFSWDNSSNILVELSHQQSEGTAYILGDSEDYNSTASANSTDGYIAFDESYSFDIPVDNMQSVNQEVTLAMWCYGNPAALPKNTSVIHANDDNGVRQLNVHLPWSNSQIYWDCGNDGSGYDRINKTANITEIAGQWNHWAFTKNTTTGSMRIYLNGNLWHSGSGMTKPIDIDQFSVGSSSSNSNYYNGDLDDLSIWDVELSQDEIQALMFSKLDTSHPKYANLVGFYAFDEAASDILNDGSSAQVATNLDEAPLRKTFRGSNVFKGFKISNQMASLELMSGDIEVENTILTTLDSVLRFPNKVVQYNVVGTDLQAEDPVYYWEANSKYTYSESGDILNTEDIIPEQTIFITNFEYYRKSPAKYELLSFVTPYGIGLDFGLDGVAWPIDITDFGPILKGDKRLVMDRGGQWQEEMDIQFLFIKGTPPRDVLNIHQVWPMRSNNYQSILSNDFLEPRDIAIEDEVRHMKLRVATTGHGQQGEFIPQQHWVDINGGFNEFSWNVWKECSENPVYPQGGTWVYDRAGWCPGEETDLQEWEFYSAVAGDDQFNIDYGLNNAAGTSNYIVNTQVVKYGDFNFETDARLERIVAPNKEIEFFRLNPICGNPIVQVRNVGRDDIKHLRLEYGVKGEEVYTHDWNGTIEFNETRDIELPVIGDGQWLKNDQFFARIVQSNNSDETYTNNNYKESQFEQTPYIDGDLVVGIRTNLLAQETRWFLYDDAGNLVASRASGFSANTYYADTIKNLNGCYQLQFVDTDDDGISWWANNDGNGVIQLRGMNGPWINLEPDFGGEISYRFTTGALTNTEDPVLINENVSLYPNPAMETTWIQMEGLQEEVRVEVFSMEGQLISYIQKDNVNPYFDEIPLDVSQLNSGSYIVKVYNENKVAVKKMMVVR